MRYNCIVFALIIIESLAHAQIIEDTQDDIKFIKNIEMYPISDPAVNETLPKGSNLDYYIIKIDFDTSLIQKGKVLISIYPPDPNQTEPFYLEEIQWPGGSNIFTHIINMAEYMDPVEPLYGNMRTEIEINGYKRIYSIPRIDINYRNFNRTNDIKTTTFSVEVRSQKVQKINALLMYKDGTNKDLKEPRIFSPKYRNKKLLFDTINWTVTNVKGKGIDAIDIRAWVI